MNTKDTRYPYTYACDCLREVCGQSADGSKMSRMDASKILQAIALALNMEDDEIAKKIADYYLAEVLGKN